MQPAERADGKSSQPAIPDNVRGNGPRTGAQAVVDALVDAGVDIVFGYPGGAIMPIYDAIFGARHNVRHVLVRHEQGAAHAAEGYARATLKVGVCMGTSGPGATNLLTGLADAMMDSTPIIAITGQVPSAMLGTDAFQEADIVGMSLPTTKWSYQVTDPNEIGWAVREGLRIATSGRPGPVLIDVTKDAQFGLVTDPVAIEPRLTGVDTACSNGRPAEAFDDAVARAAAILDSAERPLMMVGHGVLLSEAEPELKAFVERTGIPCASTLLGLGALPVDHPEYAGMLGMHGNYSTNMLTNEADVIFAVGMRFDDRVTGRLDSYAPTATIIHVDIDPAEIGKNVRTEVGIVSEAKRALAALCEQVEDREHSDWWEKFKALDVQELKTVTEPLLDASRSELSMVQVVKALSERTDGEAIVVSDVGQHQMHAARHYRFRHPNSHITSGGLGTMGFALPAAVGAAFGVRDRTVLAIVGDGGFQMNLQELGTVMQDRVPVKIVILNNDYLGMVRQWQELFFERRYSEVEIKNPDFITICAGFGIAAERVERADQLDGALQRMLETEGPYLLDVAVRKEENVFPMIPSGDAVDQIRLT